jgi:hypothetical protein
MRNMREGGPLAVDCGSGRALLASSYLVLPNAVSRDVACEAGVPEVGANVRHATAAAVVGISDTAGTGCRGGDVPSAVETRRRLG